MVGRDSALAGPGGADGLPHFRCLCLSHPWLERWAVLSCRAPLASCMDGTDSRAEGWGCILPRHLDLQQNSPVRRSGPCLSYALLNVARTCLQTPLVPEAELWDGQAGVGAGRGLFFLMFPNMGQNREGAAPPYCLILGRNKLGSKNQHRFLGTRSGGHRTPQFPFLLPLTFGLFSFCAREVGCAVRASAFLGSPRPNVYNL